jgi:hypothetical protein
MLALSPAELVPLLVTVFAIQDIQVLYARIKLVQVTALVMALVKMVLVYATMATRATVASMPSALVVFMAIASLLVSVFANLATAALVVMLRSVPTSALNTVIVCMLETALVSLGGPEMIAQCHFVKDIAMAMASVSLLELANAMLAGLVLIVLNPAVLLIVHMAAAIARVAAHASRAGKVKSATNQCAAMIALVMATACLQVFAAANSHIKVPIVRLL